MNTPLKVTKIGNSAGVILPKEVLARLFLRKNGLALSYEELDAIRTVERLAAGKLGED